MPKVTLSESASSDAAIAANAGRTFLEFSLSAGSDCRWCFGATFVSADSQAMPAGLARVFEGTPAQQAFSFGAARECVVDVTTL